MAPKLFDEQGYRALFYAHEEARMHVHVMRDGGEIKVWLEPAIEIAALRGRRMTAKETREVIELVKAHEHEIRKAWQLFFSKC